MVSCVTEQEMRQRAGCAECRIDKVSYGSEDRGERSGAFAHGTTGRGGCPSWSLPSPRFFSGCCFSLPAVIPRPKGGTRSRNRSRLLVMLGRERIRVEYVTQRYPENTAGGDQWGRRWSSSWPPPRSRPVLCPRPGRQAPMTRGFARPTRCARRAMDGTAVYGPADSRRTA